MTINFEKYGDGLVPAIVQDAATQKVLMLGFMNEPSLALTKTTGKVTLFSRSRKQIWTKGETSGNWLLVEEMLLDCDSDTLLIKARPTGPTCHTGSDTCFGEKNENADFLFELESIVKDRQANPIENSYTSSLFAEGLNRIVQKVGEEAVELIIEAKDLDARKLEGEAADLLYHLLVLLAEKQVNLNDVLESLRARQRAV